MPFEVPNSIFVNISVQIKTAPTIQMANTQRTAIQNIPPLIPTQQPTILNIRNVSIAGRQNQIQTTNASNISYITTSNSQQQQQSGQQIQMIQQQQPTIQVSNTPKFSQVNDVISIEEFDCLIRMVHNWDVFLVQKYFRHSVCFVVLS